MGDAVAETCHGRPFGPEHAMLNEIAETEHAVTDVSASPKRVGDVGDQYPRERAE